MTHYLLDSREPHAIVTSNRQELKLYHGNYYYLNNGDNFEIRVFNPLTVKIGVEIVFNGVKKSTKLLVLNPGQDVILDRFIDEQKKMVYETYEVDANSKSVQKAIENNGLIEIKFYKEKSYSPVYFSSSNFNSRGYATLGNVGGMGSCTSSHKLRSKASKSIMPDVDYSEYVAENLDRNIAYCDYQAEATMETGRVEKGETSDQNLKEVQVEFESYPFKTVTYKLLPISQKSIESKEIRLYCPNCRYRVRKDSWKYCPRCGEKFI